MIESLSDKVDIVPNCDEDMYIPEFELLANETDCVALRKFGMSASEFIRQGIEDPSDDKKTLKKEKKTRKDRSREQKNKEDAVVADDEKTFQELLDKANMRNGTDFTEKNFDKFYENLGSADLAYQRCGVPKEEYLKLLAS